MTKIILPASSVASKLILPDAPVVASLILPVDVKTVAETQLSKLAQYIALINQAFDDRIEHETKNAKDERILKNFVHTLNGMRKTASHETIASILMNAKFNPLSILDKKRAESCMYAKAIVKVNNIAQALAKVDTLNNYTSAILQSLKNFEANGLLMTQRETSACCSSDGKINDSKRNKLLVRTAKVYAPGTASVQSCSSNSALQAFNVIRSTRNAANEVCFSLNHESETTAQLLARCA